MPNSEELRLRLLSAAVSVAKRAFENKNPDPADLHLLKAAVPPEIADFPPAELARYVVEADIARRLRARE
jgi:hypothetical protein